jgi:hypothetical protein
LLIKKKKLCSSLKWIAITRMNNETINSTLILVCLWQSSDVIYFISTLYQSNKIIIIQHQHEYIHY